MAPRRRAGDRGRWPTAGPGFVEVLHAGAAAARARRRCRRSIRWAARSPGRVLRRRRHRLRGERPGRAACTCSPATNATRSITTSYGLGALLLAAVEAGARRSWSASAAPPPTTAAPACSPRWASPPLDDGRVRAAVRRGGAGRRAPGWAACPGCARRDPGRGHRRGQPADRAARRVARSTARRRAPPARTSCCSTPRWRAGPACWSETCPAARRRWRPARRRRRRRAGRGVLALRRADRVRDRPGPPADRAGRGAGRAPTW